MELCLEVTQASLIRDWFNQYFQHTDGKFSKQFSREHNCNSVVTNLETLWQHFIYHLSTHAKATLGCSKAFFVYVLHHHLGVSIKHVKNRYVGSIKAAAMARPRRMMAEATPFKVGARWSVAPSPRVVPSEAL